jgi:hypothetical protein
MSCLPLVCCMPVLFGFLFPAILLHACLSAILPSLVLRCRQDVIRFSPIVARIICAWVTWDDLKLNHRACARVRIPVCPEPPLVLPHELLGSLRTGFLVASPLRISCVFLCWERNVITSMGQEETSNGYWRVNNSPAIKRVAKHQQTNQKSKCQLAAQGYNNAITMNLLPFNLQRKQS